MLDWDSVTYVSSTGVHQEKENQNLTWHELRVRSCRIFDCILDLLLIGEMEVSMIFRSDLYFFGQNELYERKDED
jgi:hypothetical protein